MEGQYRKNIHPGTGVDIVRKADQRSGHLTRGKVDAILTRSPHHPHGIKVRLTDGQVGRVKAILSEPQRLTEKRLTLDAARCGRPGKTFGRDAVKVDGVARPQSEKFYGYPGS